jgi:hypothetical protein
MKTDHSEVSTWECEDEANTRYAMNAPSMSSFGLDRRGWESKRARNDGVKHADSVRIVPPSPPSQSYCHVCGTDVREKWFVHFSAAKPALYLCSAACALTFFDAAKPPAHDHKARHQYHRVRTRIVRAALMAEATASTRSSRDSVAAQETRKSF